MSNTKPIDEILAGWDDFQRPADGDTFRHYKGGTYKIVATGFLENTEEPCVVYRSAERNITWVRTAKNFFEHVEFEGLKKPRFVKA